jgi:hypothetical protein
VSRERGQALVEAVAAVPVCVACALVLADCGVIVRDRIAVTHAATRAAEARIEGRDELDAARGALPASIRNSARIRRDGDRIVVRATSAARITKLAGMPVVHRSSVEVER